jgi:hypothetical protein
LPIPVGISSIGKSNVTWSESYKFTGFADAVALEVTLELLLLVLVPGSGAGNTGKLEVALLVDDGLELALEVPLELVVLLVLELLLEEVLELGREVVLLLEMLLELLVLEELEPAQLVLPEIST